MTKSCLRPSPCAASRSAFDTDNSREHSIGVSVSDTNIDARMATVTTTANSLKMRPITPPIKSTGMNTATSEIEIEMMVKPISRAPFSAASMAESPSSSMWRKMFSSMTMASSTTRPTASVNPISEMLSMEKPNRNITPSVAISEIGTRHRRDDRCRHTAQEQEDHHHHQRDGEQQRELHVIDSGADRGRAVVEQFDAGRCRHLLLEGWQHRLDAVDHPRQCWHRAGVARPG